MLERLTDTAVQNAPKLILAASVIALSGAYGSQIFGGLHPCVLCLYQRVPYALVIALGLIILILEARGRSDLTQWILILAGAAFLVGGGIALFHVGVEQHWWQGTEGCVGTSGATSVEELRAQIMASPVTRCDEIPWSLFGVSMAGYNVVASLALAGFSFFAASRQEREQGLT